MHDESTHHTQTYTLPHNRILNVDSMLLNCKHGFAFKLLIASGFVFNLFDLDSQYIRNCFIRLFERQTAGPKGGTLFGVDGMNSGQSFIRPHTLTHSLTLTYTQAQSIRLLYLFIFFVSLKLSMHGH